MQARPRRRAAAVLGLVACLLLTLVWLWPLPARPASALAPDLGDPLLNTWILAWNFHQLSGGAGDYWDAPIFWPLDDTLAFSETLLPVALLTWPVWWLTGSPVLAYNTAVLASFVVAALGGFLLVTEYLRTPGGTGPSSPPPDALGAGAPSPAAPAAGAETPSPAALGTGAGAPPSTAVLAAGAGAPSTAVLAAGVVAGVLLAFSPYRLDQLAHVQVLWLGLLPLAAWAAERYLARPRARWIHLSAACATCLALTNTYFAVFGGVALLLLVALRVVPGIVGLGRRGALPRRHLGHALVAGAVSAVLLLGFGSVYRRVQAEHDIRRPPEVLEASSARPADLLRASPELWLWGEALGTRQDRFAERRLFPGAVTALLALVGLATAVARAVMPRPHGPPAPTGGPRLAGLWAARVATLAGGAAVAWWLAGGRDLAVGGLEVTMRGVGRPAALLALGAGTWLLLSPPLRGRLGALARLPLAPWGWVIAAGAVAWLLALGPAVGPDDWWLARLLPPVRGLRAVARAHAIVTLSLALLAGLGTWAVARRLPRRWAVVTALVLAALGYAESLAGGVDLNRAIWEYPAVDADTVLTAGPDDLDRRLARLPEGTPYLELPMGETQLALLYMYRARLHWRPLVNGFSGYLPAGYAELVRTMRGFPDAASLGALDRLGVEWIVVHPRLWPADDLPRLLGELARARGVEVAGRWSGGMLVRRRPVPP